MHRKVRDELSITSLSNFSFFSFFGRRVSFKPEQWLKHLSIHGHNFVGIMERMHQLILRSIGPVTIILILQTPYLELRMYSHRCRSFDTNDSSLNVIFAQLCPVTHETIQELCTLVVLDLPCVSSDEELQICKHGAICFHCLGCEHSWYIPVSSWSQRACFCACVREN